MGGERRSIDVLLWFVLVGIVLPSSVAGPVLARSAARASPESLDSHVVFEPGQKIVIRLSYSGGIESWDAGISMSEGALYLVNAGTLTVTDARGDVVQPREGKVISMDYDQMMGFPIDQVVDLSEVYDLSEPGRYEVTWGCENVATEVISLEIVE